MQMSLSCAPGDQYNIWEEDHGRMASWLWAMPGGSGEPLRAFDRRITFSRLQTNNADLTALAEQDAVPDFEVKCTICVLYLLQNVTEKGTKELH